MESQRVCFNCGASGEETCGSCGSGAMLDVDSSGAIIGLSPHLTACSRCGAGDRLLSFRRYRRVIGLFVVDLVRSTAGYYCHDCRWSMFWRWQLSTALIGWWGMLAMLFRNPYALAVNFRSLVGPPRRQRSTAP